jgi:hypothetical protein
MLTGVALARRTGDAVLAQATPTAEPGFTALFDGGSLNGWTMTGPGRFVVAGGALETEGGIGLLWYSLKQFTDVELRLEWLTTHPGDNSGVYLRFADPAGDPFNAVNSGYEVQIDDSGAPDGAPIHRTGAIYSFSPPLADAANPVGQWNQYQITVVGQQYTVRLNGTLVNKFTGNRALSGYIGLQNHHPSSRVVFRNIRARIL